MRKTTCDICGKEMQTPKFADIIKDMPFCISCYGEIWDICVECSESLNRWMGIRKAESEDV